MAFRWVVSATRWVLARERGDAEAVAPDCGRIDWNGVLRVLGRQRVLSRLAPYLAECGVSAVELDALSKRANSVVRAGMALVSDTERVAGALHRGGLDILVVKGPALAALVGHPPARRGAGDIDIWVDSADIARCIELMVEHGWHLRDHGPGYAKPGAGLGWAITRWERSEVMLVSDVRSIIDLHWRLFERKRDTSFCWDEAWAASVEVPLGASTVRTLGPRHALEHLCVHARKEQWLAIRQVLDIIDVASMIDPEVRTQMFEQLPDVRRGLLVAARLAPEVAPKEVSARDRRLSDEAWELLERADQWELARRRVKGWPAARRRWEYESWMLRSAPGVGATLGRVGRSLVKVRHVTDRRRRPWLGPDALR